MKRIIPLVLALIVGGMSTTVSAQGERTAGTVTKTMQPIIMVVPYFQKSASEISESIEKDPSVKVYCDMVSKAFLERGLTPRDFFAAQRASNLRGELQEDAADDKFTQILQGNGCDMFVTVQVVKTKRGDNTSISLGLTLFDVASGAVYGSGGGPAGREIKGDDVAPLVELVMLNTLDDFMNLIQDSFDRIVRDGRTIMIDFAISSQSGITMRTEVGANNDELADYISDWIEQNAYQNYAQKSGATKNLLSFSDVRIPIRDQVSGKNYTPSMFVRAIKNMLKAVGVQADENNVGQTVVFTLSERD